MQGHLKAYIFYAKHFLYIIWKKSRNKQCVRPHDAYGLFTMFFSQVNNEVFFWWAIPLNCKIKFLRRICSRRANFYPAGTNFYHDNQSLAPNFYRNNLSLATC